MKFKIKRGTPQATRARWSRALAEGLETRRLLSDGGLDTTFGTGGKLTWQYAPGFTPVATSVVQADGSFYVAGTSQNDFALVKFRANGTLDTTFGAAGIVKTDIGYGASSTIDVVVRLFIAADSKIVLAGKTSTTGSTTVFDELSLARYSTTGALDTTFGAGGKVAVSMPYLTDVSNVVAQSDGKLLVGTGVTAPGTTDTGAVLRFNLDGTSDSTYLAPNGFAGAIEQIAIQPDDSLVIAEHIATLQYPEIDVQKLDKTGWLLFFGSSGYNAIYPSYYTSSYRIDALSTAVDGSIILGATEFDAVGNAQLLLAKMDSRGRDDNSFGSQGVLITNEGYQSAELHSLILYGDGKILTAGAVNVGLPQQLNFAISRFTPTGALDATFGTNGITQTPFEAAGAPIGYNDFAVGLDVTADGKAVVVGVDGAYPGVGVAIARYNVNAPHQYAVLVNGVLTVTGTDSADTISLSNDTNGTLVVVANGVTQTFADSLISTINVYSKLGNDTVTITSLGSGWYPYGNYLSLNVDFGLDTGAIDSLVYNGTLGDDSISLMGTSEDANILDISSYPFDVKYVSQVTINGLGGNDLIDSTGFNIPWNSSYSPAITLSGGDGADTLRALSGITDSLDGGAGDDIIYARNGSADTINGGDGYDQASYDSYDTLSGIELALNSALSGTVFSDVNSNGTIDANEVPIAMTVYIDLNNNSIFDANERSVQTSTWGGAAYPGYDMFSFENLPAGTYTMRISNATAGWVSTTPAGGSFTKTVSQGQTISGLRFGYHQTTPNSTLTGKVFYDLNADGIKASSETYLSGRTVYVDVNDNGVLDSGEPSAITNASGIYTFTGLAVRLYRVRQISPVGWWETPAAAGSAFLISTIYNSTSTANDIGSCDRSAIAGSVFQDLNGDGVFNNDVAGNSDSYYSGNTVYLDLNNNGTLDSGEPSTQTTGNNGSYLFLNVAPGTYVAREIVPDMGAQSLPAGNAGYTVTAAMGQVALRNFAFTPYLRLDGYTYNDTNKNGIWDSGESILYVASYYIDANNNGIYDPGERYTAAQNNVLFDKVFSLTYHIGLVIPAGWAATSPANGIMTVTPTAYKYNVIYFGISQSATKASVTGWTVNDANANGYYDGSDYTLTAGTTIYADLNNNGALDSGEPSMVTGLSGYFVLTNFAPGTYTLRQIAPAGFYQTGPGGTYSFTVTLTAGQYFFSSSYFLDAPLSIAGSANRLKLDADGVRVDFYSNTTGTGTPVYQITKSRLGPLVATGTTGADSFVLDFSGGNPLPAGGMSIDAAGGSDSLLVLGSNSNDTIVAGASSIVVNSNTISIANLENVTIDPGTGLDSLSVTGGIVSLPVAATGILTRRFSSLSVSSGASLVVSTPVLHANRAVVVTDSLSIGSSGNLDLGGNDLIAHGGSLSSISALIKSAFNLNGSTHWNNVGIGSSAAAGDTRFITALGVLLNNDGAGHPIYGTGGIFGSYFDSQTPGTGDVLVKYTYYGDADLNGHVDGTDYSLVDGGFNNHKTGWFNGDFNYDGVVDGSDYSFIDGGFNNQGTPLDAMTAAELVSTSNVVTTTTAITETKPSNTAAFSQMQYEWKSGSDEHFDSVIHVATDIFAS